MVLRPAPLVTIALVASVATFAHGCASPGTTARDASLPEDDASRDATLDRDSSIDGAVPSDSGADADGGAPADAGPDAGPRDAVVIRFRGEVAGEPAACGVSYPSLGAPARAAELEDFRFYVHDLVLIDEDGHEAAVVLDTLTPWQRGGVALLDFEDGSAGCHNGTPATNVEVRGQVAPGDYVGLRFTLGVPFAANHQDRSAASAPLDLSALFWNWRGGYIFARVDLRTVADPDGGVPFGWSAHLGSTDCDGSSVSGGTTTCVHPNRPTIELPAFDRFSDVVVADVVDLVEDVDLSVNTAGTALGCMSATTDPECLTVLPSFGLDFGASAGAMDFFHVESP